MTQKQPATGAQLEAYGLLTFSCDICRDLFPVRCEAHRVLPEQSAGKEEPAPPRVRMKARQPRTSGGAGLTYGRPLLAYTAPYETLTEDIADILKTARD